MEKTVRRTIQIPKKLLHRTTYHPSQKVSKTVANKDNMFLNVKNQKEINPNTEKNVRRGYSKINRDNIIPYGKNQKEIN